MPIPSPFDDSHSDIPVQGTVAIPTANAEVDLWNSTRVPAGTSQMDLSLADAALVGTCQHVKGIVVFVRPTTQAITVRLYWRVGSTWTIVNGSGSGESVTAGSNYSKLLPCGGIDTKITLAAGATPPSALLAHARLRDSANTITVP